MPIGKAVLEPKSRKNEGQGHLSQQLGGWCWLEGKGWVIYAAPFGGATEARHSGHLLMCAWSFQREKLPKAKHFIQIQICTEKCSLTKKTAKSLTQTKGVRRPLKRAGRSLQPVKSLPAASPQLSAVKRKSCPREL